MKQANVFYLICKCHRVKAYTDLGSAHEAMMRQQCACHTPLKQAQIQKAYSPLLPDTPIAVICFTEGRTWRYVEKGTPRPPLTGMQRMHMYRPMIDLYETGKPSIIPERTPAER